MKNPIIFSLVSGGLTLGIALINKTDDLLDIYKFSYTSILSTFEVFSISITILGIIDVIPNKKKIKILKEIKNELENNINYFNDVEINDFEKELLKYIKRKE